MNVIVPYTHINPIVKQVLNKQCYEDLSVLPSYIKMTDDECYWRLMCELWERMETVIIVEHDIIPWPTALRELANCPYSWCSYTYRMKEGYGIHHAFGCTKFGEKLMEKIPDIWSRVETTMWKHLDAQFSEIAKIQGITPHPHRPPVIHLKGLYETHATQESQFEIPEGITKVPIPC